MSIENDIFQRFQPNIEKLLKFGFERKNGVLCYETKFYNNEFQAELSISKSGELFGKVIDLDNGEEYLPLRFQNRQGSFVSEVRSSYEEVLKSICENCFDKKYYIYPQSNRITDLIIKKYKSEPEFLWEKFQGTGIFRNNDSGKWFGIIMDIDNSKIQKGKSGIIEVLNIKLFPDHVKEIIKKTNFYEAYHMNKKYWISIIMNDTVSDKEIMNLVDESYGFTIKKSPSEK